MAERQHLECLREAPSQIASLPPIGLGVARRRAAVRFLTDTLSANVERGCVGDCSKRIAVVVLKDAPVGRGEDFLRGGDGFGAATQQPPHEVVDGSTVQLVVAHERIALAVA